MNQAEQVTRVPELDGLRGVAILMVMSYHFILLAAPFTNNSFLKTTLVNAVSLGWAGVDLFFVLSGFLITSILLKTRSDPHYFKNFYARRVLRIFPLYYLFVVIMLISVPFFSPHVNLAATRSSWPFYMSYLHNWLYIPKFAGKVAVMAPLTLGATWSIAIEEQFYFLWPSVVYFLNRRKLFMLSIVVVALSLALRLGLVEFAGSWKSLEYFLYYSSITRFDGLCVGALIALAFESERWKAIFSRMAWPVFIAALAGMIGIVLANNDVFALSTNPYLDMWGYTLLALGSGALVVLVSSGASQGMVRVLFRNPVLRFFGKYSYSMYLIHLPIIYLLVREFNVFHFRGEAVWFIFGGLFLSLTILGALLTWHLLEKHAFALKKHFEYEPAKNEA